MATIETIPAMVGTKGDPTNAMAADTGRISRSDQEKINRVWRNIEKDKAHKEAIVNPRDLERYALIYGDRHWSGDQKEWQSTPTINLSWAAVNSILPILTDNRPQWTVLPRTPEDSEVASILRAVFEWLWEENSCSILLPKTCLNTLVFGNGFWKLRWNPDLHRGSVAGDIEILDVDPTNILFNPETTSIENAERVTHVEQVPVSKVKRMFPDMASKIKPGTRDSSFVVNRPHQSQAAGSGAATIRYEDTKGSLLHEFPQSAARAIGPDTNESVTVAETWSVDEETGMWRKTTVTQDLLLEDTLTAHETPPFVHFMDHSVGWTVWATGEIQHVENLQHELNKRRGMILDILRFGALPMLVYDPASGADLENIEARPGLTIPAEGGSQGVSWLVPQMDLSGLFRVSEMDKQDFNDILGNVDVIQGKTPSGVEAGVAIEALQEAANTRIRGKIRNLEFALQRAGKILIHFIQKHYTTHRVFRLVGNQATSHLNPGFSPAQANPSFFSINTPSGVDPDGNPMFDENSNAIPSDSKFDVRVGAGSTLPVSRTALFSKAITLYDRGALPLRELLKAADWQNPEQLAQEMEQKQMQQALGLQGASDPDQVSPEDLADIPESIFSEDQFSGAPV